MPGAAQLGRVESIEYFPVHILRKPYISSAREMPAPGHLSFFLVFQNGGWDWRIRPSSLGMLEVVILMTTCAAKPTMLRSYRPEPA